MCAVEGGYFSYELDTTLNTCIVNSKRWKFITPSLELISENGPFEYRQITYFFLCRQVADLYM